MVATRLPRGYNVFATWLPRVCHVVATWLPRGCHVETIALPQIAYVQVRKSQMCMCACPQIAYMYVKVRKSQMCMCACPQIPDEHVCTSAHCRCARHDSRDLPSHRKFRHLGYNWMQCFHIWFLIYIFILSVRTVSKLHLKMTMSLDGRKSVLIIYHALVVSSYHEMSNI